MTYEANIKEFMDKKKKKKKKKIILFTLNDFFISYITTLYGKLTKIWVGDVTFTFSGQFYSSGKNISVITSGVVSKNNICGAFTIGTTPLVIGLTNDKTSMEAYRVDHVSYTGDLTTSVCLMYQ